MTTAATSAGWPQRFQGDFAHQGFLHFRFGFDVGVDGRVNSAGTDIIDRDVVLASSTAIVRANMRKPPLEAQ